MSKEKTYITGETFDQVCDRYRAMYDGWGKLTHKEKLERINSFRGGY